MRRPLIRVGILLVSTLAFVLLAEAFYRLLGPSPDAGELYYADADYVEFDLDDPEDVARAQQVIEVVPDAPRFRMRFKPDVLVHLCYRGYGGRAPFDAHGCVELRTNSCGIREREELCEPKPPGQTRIVCLGDSTTVGWGVPVETTWTRRAEALLRQQDDGIRMVNCGASGTLIPDEYAHALESRFGRLEPDLVLVTLCVNDLLPVNGGMAHFAPDALATMSDPIGGVLGLSRFASDLVRGVRQRDAMWLDPSRDWVTELLALPVENYPPAARQLGRVYWDSGVPRASLRRMRDWCEQRNVRFAVALWPFLQQLETRREHPFRGVHDRLAAFCDDEGMPFLDLLGAFVGEDPRALWVTPRDMHGNASAHALAAPRVAEFLHDLLVD